VEQSKARTGFASVIGWARDEWSRRHPCRTKGKQANFGRHAASVDDKDIKSCVGLLPYNSPRKRESAKDATPFMEEGVNEIKA
jgi:hypothetical protein